MKNTNDNKELFDEGIRKAVEEQITAAKMSRANRRLELRNQMRIRLQTQRANATEARRQALRERLRGKSVSQVMITRKGLVRIAEQLEREKK